MIVIRIPSNNIPERRYAIRMVLGHFLGLDYQISESNSNHTELLLDEKRIIFADCFWNDEKPLNYLSKDNFPIVRSFDTEYAPEGCLPALYGEGEFEKLSDGIYCPIDVFASVFFMLTRWEEFVEKEKDKTGRFAGSNSVAYRSNFISRPIVNEYVEMVWMMMVSIGYKGGRKKGKFEIVPTHDIDHPFMCGRLLRTGYYIVKNLLKFDWKSTIAYIKDVLCDPYNVYDFFMDNSEKVGVKSRFYFMSADPSTEVNQVSPYINGKNFSRIIRKIKQRGHIIGFHPGVYSLKSDDNWRKEKERLEHETGVRVVEGRQHYLSFSVPDTFRIWENNNMVVDSTLSYHDVEGFRCGTGNSYPVFDVLERKELKLQERPLIVMDATLTGYQNYSLDKIKEVLYYYVGIGKKYRMPITILFHNSSFVGRNGKELKKIYKELFTKLK